MFSRCSSTLIKCCSNSCIVPVESISFNKFRCFSSDSNVSKGLYPGTIIPIDEAWKRRIATRKPKLQRDEEIASRMYYAPEWDLSKRPNNEEGDVDPTKGYGMTPEKWEYHNKIVWPPNYVNPETGLPLLRQVYHCRESFHFSPKRMWIACQFVWRMNVDEAMLQLKFQPSKSCRILREVIEEAKHRAHDEFHVEYPSDMHVAEAFPVQCNIVKGLRRHAHENWNMIRYRYINLFVRLEEGPGPSFKKREPPKNGWEEMEEYYQVLRNRSIKYSLK